MKPSKGECVYNRCVSVPDGMSTSHALIVLADAAKELATERAVEDAVPDGPWDGLMVIANLRAAGYDVVAVTR